MSSFKNRLRSVRGASLIEYTTLACVMCTALIVPLQGLSSNSAHTFSEVNAALRNSRLYDNTSHTGGGSTLGDGGDETRGTDSSGGNDTSDGTGTWGSTKQEIHPNGYSAATDPTRSGSKKGDGKSNSQTDDDPAQDPKSGLGGGNKGAAGTKGPR